MKNATSNKPLIIAEVGVNHNGDLDLGRKLIDVAVECGADIVKFQTFIANRLATGHAPQASYQKQNLGVDQSQINMLAKLELTHEMHVALLEHCRSKNIEFLSTAFDAVSLDYLVDLGIKRIKVPSGELTNLPYLEEVASKGLPVILSTGMADLDEVRDGVAILMAGGVARGDLTILHCTSNYPAQPGELNMLAVRTLYEEFGCDVGYSDHSSGYEAALLAVALGARVLEKHITLDRTMSGPDHLASMEPDDFKIYVRAARMAVVALGNGVKKPSKAEAENALIVRKSIVASRPISIGEVFSKENLTTKRPGAGMSPMRWHHVIGKQATRDFAADEMIEV